MKVRRLTLIAAAVVAATGWPLRIADDVAVVAAPTDDELAALRALEVA